ncbi:MAG: DUF4231 domain-containing protein [Candidatus Brocadiaceae bacterium]|nr:DUF4231 domain-containing protein [Candidatus Brocadiaceae bacterium]
MSKEEVFLRQINDKILKFDRASSHHKLLYRIYRYILIAFVAITSISSGLALSFDWLQTELNIVILVVGALSGVVTSIEGMRQPLELWRIERNTYYSLLELKEKYECLTADSSQEDINYYHQHMEEILNASKETWNKAKDREDSGADNINP